LSGYNGPAVPAVSVVMPIPHGLCACILAGIVLSPTARAADDSLNQPWRALPPLTAELVAPQKADWLMSPIDRKAGVYRTDHENEIVLCNGLISRTFRLAPNAATVAMRDLTTDQSLLRGVKPEAQVTLDGVAYAVGGLSGQVDYAYLLPQWLKQMKADPAAFRCVGFSVGKPASRLQWKRTRYAGESTWPPPGVALALEFEPPASAAIAAHITVHYELYDAIPLICKWVTVRNDGARPIRLDTFISEQLAAVETDPNVEDPRALPPPMIHVETDYAFYGTTRALADDPVQWLADPQYQTQVDYARKNPNMLECRSPVGPDQTIEPKKSFDTFRAFELIPGSTDRERRSLAVRRMYRTLAPWTSENPIMMHVISVDPAVVKTAIDQAADVGFEMVILSFGSGLNMEDVSEANLEKFKSLAAYAHQKHIQIGGYSLLASRTISPESDAINPATGKPGGAIFGNSPCLGSQWGIDYFTHLKTFLTKTDFDLLEHDGSYPGDLCASTTHPGHRGVKDSQWNQWRVITDFYAWCRANGIYLNVPDWYYLSGSNKCGMGYRETNWSLPRAQQIIHGRQNIYDGTWDKTPAMGWMFVPLTQYHGGGQAATIEPLSKHLDAYAAHLANNFGAGVQACYRGMRLYDTPETRDLVKKWVDFYRAHRQILDSDVIHVRRADGRDIDCILHVNPRLKSKGLAMVYNPLDQTVVRQLRLPLYYTGLTDAATVREQNGPPRRYTLDRHDQIELPIQIKPRSSTWFTIE
jgi:hypothetical protein